MLLLVINRLKFATNVCSDIAILASFLVLKIWHYHKKFLQKFTDGFVLQNANVILTISMGAK